MGLKVGVVGLRDIGKKHASCHMKDELADLVAVCDLIKERADEVAKKHQVRAYTSLTQMLANEDLDIVDICTGGYENASWHFEPVIQALEAGIHVLVEKPLAGDINEARMMVATAREKKLYLGCNLNHYFTPPADHAAKYIAEGKIGELVYCLHRMGFPGGEHSYQIPNGPAMKNQRYFHMKAFLAHPFSIMRHFCGDITHIQTFATRPSFRKRAGDVMLSINSIHVKFANDCVGYLMSQRGDATLGLGGWWSVEVGGTIGTFAIENCVEKFTYWPAPGSEDAAKPEDLNLGNPHEPTVIQSGMTDFGETFPIRIHAFLEDVTHGVPKEHLRASGYDALASLEYTWAAMESAENGGALVRPAPLPSLRGDPLDYRPIRQGAGR